MTRNDDERVADIVDAARQLAAIVAGGSADFSVDPLRQLAAERLLEIVGEAARAMSDEARARYPGVGWSDLIGLRTLLAHHYHRVDPHQVWAIAAESVPALVVALEAGT